MRPCTQSVESGGSVLIWILSLCWLCTPSQVHATRFFSATAELVENGLSVRVAEYVNKIHNELDPQMEVPSIEVFQRRPGQLQRGISKLVAVSGANGCASIGSANLYEITPEVNAPDSERHRGWIHDVALKRYPIGVWIWGIRLPVFNLEPLAHGGFLQVDAFLHCCGTFLGGGSAFSHFFRGTGHFSGLIPDQAAGDRPDDNQQYADEQGGAIYPISSNVDSRDCVNRYMWLGWFVGGGFWLVWLTIVPGTYLLLDSRRLGGWILVSLGMFCAVLVGVGGCWGICQQNKCMDEDERQKILRHSSKIVTQKHLTTINSCNTVISMANVLNTDKQIGVISALAEGSSIRSIERMTGVHRDTIMRLGVKVGQGCTALMDAKMRDLSCTRLELDEIWGFIGKKDRNVRLDEPRPVGNVWTLST